LRIGIEAKMLTSRPSGIGRYAINLVRSLLKTLSAKDDTLEIVLFTGPQTARRVLDALSGPYREHFCAMQSSLLRSLFSLPYGIVRHNVNVFHGLDHVGLPLFFKRGIYVITVHDVIPLLFPQLFTLKHRLIVRAGLARVAQQADVVIVPSYAVQQDVQQYLRIDADRVVVIPEGCEPRFRPLMQPESLRSVQTKYGLPPLYILCLGTLEPRKNITTLLHAFARLWSTLHGEPVPRLVVAGARGWRESAIFQTVQCLGLEQAVYFPGFIDDEDLPAIYGGALCFVFPSLYEGFGLPILEAMGCGTPVITSNVAAIPEVAGDAALLIDPQDVEGIAAAMRVLVHNDTIRERLRQKGFIQAQRFSWETTAQKTLDLYRSLGG
jgi:glycosyltransferase involved in cell wall biosynthesis